MVERIRKCRWFTWSVALSCGLALAGCDGEDEGEHDTSVTPDVVDPDIIAGRYACTDLPPLPAPSVVRLEPAFPQTSGNSADGMLFAEESPAEPGRWYTVHLSGRVYTFVVGQEGRELALDISSELWSEHPEVGLTSMALAPDFAENGVAYVLYAADAQVDDMPFVNRVARVRSTDGGLTFDPATLEPILDVPQPVPVHSVNHIRFGLDGMLYIAGGDGGNTHDWPGNGPNPFNFWATILRIDVSAPGVDTYAIPVDNPFADGVEGAPEVWAYGLRNVWRFSIDRETGEVWAGDVGEASREEVNRVVAGGHHGWSVAEGDDCFRDRDCSTDADQLVWPEFAYSHSEGASITGGYVYRGDAIPELYGRYVFADFSAGTIWALDETEDGRVEAEVLAETGLPIVTFAEDLDGEIYAGAYGFEGDGGLFRLVPNDDAAYVGDFALSQTGCVSAEDPRAWTSAVIPYDVTAELWSDGAQKRRGVVMPPDTRIEVDSDGDFELPVGTVLVKEFAYDGDPHETRLFVHHDVGWAGYSFAWNADRTDATLLSYGQTTTLSSGREWTFPSRGTCFRCHTEEAGVALGTELPQLATNDGGRAALAAFEAGGWLYPGDAAWEGARLAEPTGDAALDLRARSYLHANCAGCHRPGVREVRSEMDLRIQTALADARICDVEPEHGDLWGAVPDARLVAPGIRDSSVLYRRTVTLDAHRMPQIGTSVVDLEGTEVLGQWIDSLAACP